MPDFNDPNYVPNTRVSVGAYKPGELEARVKKARDENGPLLQSFAELFYTSGCTWNTTQFLGVGTMKAPNDLWVYQDIIAKFKPKTIIETGTWAGASAMYFAVLMDLLGIDGEVRTVDYLDQRLCAHPRVKFFLGRSTDPRVAEAVLKDITYPLLISLDSDHTYDHVLEELRLYAPACRPHDWLVVEDTNVSWPEEEGRPADAGAAGATWRYINEHAGEWRQDILCERYLSGCHPGGWLQRMAPCQHDR